MNVGEPSQNRLEVLIDADNAQPAITEGLLSEFAKYCRKLSFRGFKDRIYYC